jgi:hypothetical protein
MYHLITSHSVIPSPMSARRNGRSVVREAYRIGCNPNNLVGGFLRVRLREYIRLNIVVGEGGVQAPDAILVGCGHVSRHRLRPE